MPRYRAFDEGVGAWERIETQVLAATATTITFSSISTDYMSLRIEGRLRTQGTFNLSLTFNSDTGSNYAYARKESDAAIASASAQANMLLFSPANSGANEAAWLEFDVKKPESDLEASCWFRWVEHSTTSVAILGWGAGHWQNVADKISQIDLTASVADSFKVGTRLTLLGSKHI